MTVADFAVAFSYYYSCCCRRRFLHAPVSNSAIPSKNHQIPNWCHQYRRPDQILMFDFWFCINWQLLLRAHRYSRVLLSYHRCYHYCNGYCCTVSFQRFRQHLLHRNYLFQYQIAAWMILSSIRLCHLFALIGKVYLAGPWRAADSQPAPCCGLDWHSDTRAFPFHRHSTTCANYA